MGGDGRIRTADGGFADPCLATWLRRPTTKLVYAGKSAPSKRRACQARSWPDGGTTGRRDAFRLLGGRKKNCQEPVLAVGAEDGIRTRDPHLGKVMLYH
jgi:hypothetical protein